MESNTLDKNERNWADERIPPVRLGLREKKFVLQKLVVFPLKLQNLWLLNNYMGNCLDKDESTDTHSDQHVELASGNVKLISSTEAWEQKLEEATRDGKTVILNFSATWCGPCKMIAPYYCELSEKFTSIVFLIVDVDELSDFAATWDIKATPTFFFFQNGQQVDKLVGANKPELQKKIAAITDSVPKWQ
ncbi:thioredoxin H-type isoform X1 [Arachis ipaensis]|nr:thioredoxin H-type isoform X1 [Arachis ipaensis]XP_020977260.1 thioredoxin H-type isoform X1 [Arachis ipaensis]